VPVKSERVGLERWTCDQQVVGSNTTRVPEAFTL